MNFVATILNFAMLLVSLCLIVIYGINSQGAYILYAMLLLTVPVLNLITIYPDSKNQNWFSFTLKSKKDKLQDISTEHSPVGYFLITLVITLNMVMLGLTVWTIIDQYPNSVNFRPAVFSLLVFITPLLSLLAIFRNRFIIGHFSIS